MEPLTQDELKRLLAFLSEIYTLRTWDAFLPNMLRHLQGLISSDIVSYNEVDPIAQRIEWRSWPRDGFDFTDSQAIFISHMAEYLPLRHYQKTGDGQARKMSDFISQRRFLHTGLYRDFYRPAGVDYHMVFDLPADGGLAAGIDLNRMGADFSERDRLLANLARPHIAQALQNVRQQSYGASLHILEGREHGFPIRQATAKLAVDGSFGSLDPLLRQWLKAYFNYRSPDRHLPPQRLRDWLRHLAQNAHASEAVLQPPHLMIEGAQGRLVVRHFKDKEGEYLVFTEMPKALPAGDLVKLGLSRREAEVLSWVMQGKSNREIGAILGLSPRTIQTHLERLYQKLGVASRTEAALAAWQSLTLPLFRPD